MTASCETVVLVNWPATRPFPFAAALASLSGDPVETIGGWFPQRFAGAGKLVHWLQYFLVPLKALVTRHRVRRVICWQQGYGIALALLLRALPLRVRLDVYVLTFIVKPAKQRGALRWLIDAALGCENVRAVVCYNEDELARYRAIFPRRAHKLFAARFTEDLPERPPGGVAKGDYYLAAGRSNRDYAFLADFFARHPERTLYVVCDALPRRRWPPNVRIFDATYGDDYLALLAGCHAVLLAFEDETISAGQLVFLKALQLGKPVVATQSSCLRGYLLHDRNGYEVPKSDAALAGALAALDAPGEYARIAAFQVEDFRRRFGTDALAGRVLELIRATAAR
jgi:glycosyltransferase involved in cell wall biosynthesis